MLDMWLSVNQYYPLQPYPLYCYYLIYLKIRAHRLSKGPTIHYQYFQFSSVQSCPILSDPMICSTPGLRVHTNSQSLLKPMSIEWVMPSNHLILCRPLILLPSIFPRIRVFSNESSLRIRWPKYWSFSFNISPSNEHSGLISYGWTGWSPHSPRDSQVFSNTTVQKHQFFSAQLSL